MSFKFVTEKNIFLKHEENCVKDPSRIIILEIYKWNDDFSDTELLYSPFKTGKKLTANDF